MSVVMCLFSLLFCLKSVPLIQMQDLFLESFPINWLQIIVIKLVLLLTLNTATRFMHFWHMFFVFFLDTKEPSCIKISLTVSIRLKKITATTGFWYPAYLITVKDGVCWLSPASGSSEEGVVMIWGLGSLFLTFCQGKPDISTLFNISHLFPSRVTEPVLVHIWTQSRCLFLDVKSRVMGKCFHVKHPPLFNFTVCSAWNRSPKIYLRHSPALLLVHNNLTCSSLLIGPFWPLAGAICLHLVHAKNCWGSPWIF